MRHYAVDNKGVEHVVYLGIEEWWVTDRESFLMLTPSKYNIETVEDCDLLITTKEQSTRLKTLSPLYVKLSLTLDERHHLAAEDRIQKSISYSAEEKVKALLEKYPVFFQRFPQNIIASYLGLTPETLSRIRKQVHSK